MNPCLLQGSPFLNSSLAYIFPQQFRIINRELVACKHLQCGTAHWNNGRMHWQTIMVCQCSLPLFQSMSDLMSDMNEWVHVNWKNCKLHFDTMPHIHLCVHLHMLAWVHRPKGKGEKAWSGHVQMDTWFCESMWLVAVGMETHRIRLWCVGVLLHSFVGPCGSVM